MSIKKKLSTVMLSVCTLALVASAGTAVYLTTASGEEEDAIRLTMKNGASIRCFEPTGIRFITEISAKNYQTILEADSNAVFGTLILPKSVLGDTIITAENYLTLDAERIVANNSWTTTASGKEFSGALVGGKTENDGEISWENFPVNAYTMELTAVSYCAYNNTVIFAENPQNYSIAYIASALMASGATDTYFSSITDTVLGDNLKFEQAEYNVAGNAASALETVLLNDTSVLNMKAVYSSENEDVVVVDKDGKLTATGIGNATITATIGNKSATATVNVERFAPILTMTGDDNFTTTEAGGQIDILEGEESSLTVSAKDCEGGVLTLVPDVSDAKLSFEDGKVSGEKGNYTITYTISDPQDSGLITTKVITVNIYRKVLGSLQDGTFSVVNEKVADSEQVVQSSVNGVQWASFNLTPSFYYYSEVIYKNVESVGGVGMGMGHYLANNRSRFLVSHVDGSDKNFKLTDFNTAVNGVWDEAEWNSDGLIVMHQYRLSEYGSLLANAEANTTKYAVARIGDYFYSFWNDQYVSCVKVNYFSSVETIPGLFLRAVPTSGSITNVVYYGGQTQVQTKVDELTDKGAKMIRGYAPDDRWGYGDSFTSKGNFTIGETTTEKGINFNFTKNDKEFNSGCVSPYLYLDGDFTFSWTYKSTSTTGGEPRMLLEVRNYRYQGSPIQFGGQYSNGDLNRFLLNVPGNPEGSKWNEPGAGTDGSQGARFTITRKVYEDKATFTLTATSIANPSQTFIRTFDWTAEDDNSGRANCCAYFWNQPVLFQWHNTCVAGEYSNITWSSTVA